VSVLIGDLTWEQLAADDRVRRLRRGKHFTGDVKSVQREASAAASQMGRVARVVRDDFRKYAYVWVQFVDFQVPLGAPCPNCAGRDIVRVHEHFGRCPSCGASLALLPRVESAEGAPDEPGSNPKIAAKRARVASRRRSRRLNEFTDVQLVFDPEESDEEQEVWYGRGDREDGPYVLHLVYPLSDGARQMNPDDPDEELYYIRFWGLAAYQRAAGLGLDLDS
jgi:hypothetical protein